MARSSSASRTVTCWFARMQAGLIERLQGRVELGEGAFLAGRQAVGVVAADVAAHARIESPGGMVGFRLAFPGQ
jgi:hypothetical protein